MNRIESIQDFCAVLKRRKEALHHEGTTLGLGTGVYCGYEQIHIGDIVEIGEDETNFGGTSIVILDTNSKYGAAVRGRFTSIENLKITRIVKKYNKLTVEELFEMLNAQEYGACIC